MTLDKQRWEQIETLYHAAMEREPLARAAFLEEACAGDQELRRKVEELLLYDGAAESFIQGNAPAFEAGGLSRKSQLRRRLSCSPDNTSGRTKSFRCSGAAGWA